jgi:outer membrane protein OmpA-like peptidoglycan-associated protein
MVKLLTSALLGLLLVKAPGGTSRIPLCAGLTIVTAIDDPKGDYESIKRVTRVTSTSVEVVVNGDRPMGSTVRRIVVPRTILRGDLKNATFYLHHFDTRAPATVPGSTALGTSAAVLASLKTSGSAEIQIVDPVARAAPPEEMRRNFWPYKLQRVGTPMVPILVNGVRVDLPAIQARGEYMGDRAEFVFLDDESNPIALKYRFSSGPQGDESAKLQVVQISYNCSGEKAEITGADRLERALLQQGRADVYEIYFEFNSARIREVSEPTLEDIAAVMKRHPDWKLGIEGHTDSIAGDAYNKDLSERRAAAVKDALTGRYQVTPTRLRTAGFGESRPKDRNDTLEGRARNRRVELVREQ